MKWCKRLLLAAMAAVILAGCGIGWQGWKQYETAVALLPIEEAAEDIRTQAQFTPIESLPTAFCQAVVAVEDRRFYRHNGFDPIGTLRALVTDFKARKMVEGGSTLTQQLAKNIYFPQDNTPQRKFAEIFMALDLERHFNKEEILELYCNGIYYGSGYYTVYDAAVGYFGKAPLEMNLDECTLLAGIPNAPSVYSPDVNPELARQRQAQVIDAMVSCGYLRQAEAIALQDEIKTNGEE